MVFGANMHDNEYAIQQSYANFFFFITGFHGFHVFSGVVINIIIFFMALVLPCAFFTERLLFTAATIKNQIIGFVGVFMVIWIVLSLVHPAFQLSNPFVILLAFVIIALAVLVMSIISGRFNEQMKKLRTEVAVIHDTDVSRCEPPESGCRFTRSDDCPGSPVFTSVHPRHTRFAPGRRPAPPDICQSSNAVDGRATSPETLEVWHTQPRRRG